MRSRVPVTTPEQLNAAYVPVIRLPLTVAVTLKGHVKGLLGVSVRESDDPVNEPLAVPPLSLRESEKLVDHVPDTLEPD